jgi:hypothetical protein
MMSRQLGRCGAEAARSDTFEAISQDVKMFGPAAFKRSDQWIRPVRTNRHLRLPE